MHFGSQNWAATQLANLLTSLGYNNSTSAQERHRGKKWFRYKGIGELNLADDYRWWVTSDLCASCRGVKDVILSCRKGLCTIYMYVSSMQNVVVLRLRRYWVNAFLYYCRIHIGWPLHIAGWKIEDVDHWGETMFMLLSICIFNSERMQCITHN